MRRVSSFMVALVMVIGVGVANAEVPKPSVEQLASFKKKVKERDSLYQQLRTLDRRAADAIKRGEKPTRIHAEQVSIQQRLDLLELQIDLFATRFEMDVPARPDEKKDADGAKSSSEVRIEKAFEIGRRRAVRELSSDCRRMMASIDFTTFLAN